MKTENFFLDPQESTEVHLPPMENPGINTEKPPREHGLGSPSTRKLTEPSH